MGMERNMLNEATGNVNNITNQYVNTSQNLANQAQRQAQDASTTYSGTIKPLMLNNISDAQNFQRNIAGQAMSLAESMDANNKVVYKEGEVDFIVKCGSRLLPIEVKAGVNSRQFNLAMLSAFVKKYKSPFGVVFY